MRDKKGFTLIELLVVISIIALLLSILMPALQLAKQQARYVVCKTRLTSVGKVAALYANDHEEKVPGGPDAYRSLYAPYYDESYYVLNDAVQDNIAASEDDPADGGGDQSPVDVGKFMSENNWPYACEDALKKTRPQNDEHRYTFAINHHIDWYGFENGKAVKTMNQAIGKMTTPKIPSDTLFFSDAGHYIDAGNADGGKFWGCIDGFSGNMPSFYHFGGDMKILGTNAVVYDKGRTNVLFFDGHTEGRKVSQWIVLPDKLTAEQIDAGMSDTGSRMFWLGGM